MNESEPQARQHDDEIAPGYLSTAGALKYLSIQRHWLYQHLDEIPHLKVDRLLRFKVSDLDEWMEKNRRV